MLQRYTYGPRFAYFSMEIALRSDIPTYAGGLGCWRAIRCVPPPIWKFPWWR